MSCNRLANRLDAFLDGDIPASERSVLEEHVAGCADCSALLAREHRLQRALKSRSVPEVGADVLERALTRAAHGGSQRRTVRWWPTALGGALAAGLAFWTVLGVLRQPTVERAAPVASVTMDLHETRTIQLVFASPAKMRNARLSLSLPPGVELAGYAGRSEIRWRTSLQRGKNVLPLELVVQEGSGGDLVARIEHGRRQKTFRTRVVIRQDRDDRASTNGSTTV
jgi:putative zinc finger protein